MSLSDDMMRVAKEPIKTEPLFEKGQSVKVRDWVFDDGQTPSHWGDGECVVVHAVVSGALNKFWSYEVMHQDGRVCCFKEEELEEVKA